MPTCTKCGAEYEHGPGGWAGICNACIQKLVGELEPKKPGEGIIASNVTPSIPEPTKPRESPYSWKIYRR